MKLAIDRLRTLLHYDPDSGHFTWLVDRNGRKFAGTEAGNISPDGHIQIMIDGVNYKGHRLAWMYVHGQMPRYGIDHRDHNRSNNAICNLRDVTQSCNMQNMITANVDSLTGILGVTFDRKNKKYRAQIRVDGRNRPLGRFQTSAEAQAAYLKAKRAMHEGCTL